MFLEILFMLFLVILLLLEYVSCIIINSLAGIFLLFITILISHSTRITVIFREVQTSLRTHPRTKKNSTIIRRQGEKIYIKLIDEDIDNSFKYLGGCVTEDMLCTKQITRIAIANLAFNRKSFLWSPERLVKLECGAELGRLEMNERKGLL